MTPFEEQIAGDNAAIFLNEMEFAQKHLLNGVSCTAIVQDISVAEALSTGNTDADTYPGVYGRRLQVNVLADALPDGPPVYGRVFNVDGQDYLVESCADDMGILTIQLIENDR
ncbi:MAG: hypothetical protein ACI3WT_07860 [Phascolarctobacterium sp.]